MGVNIAPIFEGNQQSITSVIDEIIRYQGKVDDN